MHSNGKMRSFIGDKQIEYFEKKSEKWTYWNCEFRESPLIDLNSSVIVNWAHCSQFWFPTRYIGSGLIWSLLCIYLLLIIIIFFDKSRWIETFLCLDASLLYVFLSAGKRIVRSSRFGYIYRVWFEFGHLEFTATFRTAHLFNLLAAKFSNLIFFVCHTQSDTTTMRHLWIGLLAIFGIGQIADYCNALQNNLYYGNCRFDNNTMQIFTQVVVMDNPPPRPSPSTPVPAQKTRKWYDYIFHPFKRSPTTTTPPPTSSFGYGNIVNSTITFPPLVSASNQFIFTKSINVFIILSFDGISYIHFSIHIRAIQIPIWSNAFK